jgi:hypothetical protein
MEMHPLPFNSAVVIDEYAPDDYSEVRNRRGVVKGRVEQGGSWFYSVRIDGEEESWFVPGDYLRETEDCAETEREIPPPGRKKTTREAIESVFKKYRETFKLLAKH